ncbi:MAG: CDP-alcohol phosphatidyltransferase family protein [Dehalococcoidia bacterium]|nr:MAG: CDP-alcohol phosphatidyltransferase family protein [Dehalococcoidia bacterium]
MTKLSQSRQLLSCYLTQPLAKLLARISFITPNTITCAGFLVTLGAAGLIATRHLFAAGWVVLLAGFLDILDGALARHTGQVSRFGAILDSTVDRLSEAALLFGILIFSLREQLALEIVLVCLALIGSMMVSYIRARAEGLGLECQVGLFTRAERVIVLALGLLLSQFNYALTIALVIITLFSFITASQRFLHVWQQTRNN